MRTIEKIRYLKRTEINNLQSFINSNYSLKILYTDLQMQLFVIQMNLKIILNQNNFLIT